MRNQKGFTLIELVVVIVILGILAATALPKFVDMKGDAAQAAVSGAAGALSSASTINYAASSVRGPTHASVTRLDAAGACATLITGGMATWDSSKFSVTGTDATCAAATAGTVRTCSILSADDNTKSATASIICTG